MNWDILLKYINNEADANELIIVENWLKKNPQNRALLDYLLRRSHKLNAPLKESDIDEQWLRLLDRIFQQPIGNEKVKSINIYRTLSIAASILLISTIGLLIFRPATQQPPQLVTLQTPANRQGTVLLPDGTEVFLAPATRLQYDQSFGRDNRRLKIDGEAFFAVKHDRTKPFIVSTRYDMTVTVLGTSFNVYSRKNHNPEVKVATGLVGVTANHHTSFLKAGQQLVYRLRRALPVTAAVDPKDAASLKNHVLFFKNSNAQQIAAKLERWYNIHIIVLPSAKLRSRFSGEMKDTGMHNLLAGLNYATGLKYRYKNAHTIILF